MLHKIYELIEKLEKEIGNDARVELSVRGDRLVVRVDWVKTDFHARYDLSHHDLTQVVDDSLPITFLIDWARHLYASKMALPRNTR